MFFLITSENSSWNLQDFSRKMNTIPENFCAKLCYSKSISLVKSLIKTYQEFFTSDKPPNTMTSELFVFSTT